MSANEMSNNFIISGKYTKTSKPYMINNLSLNKYELTSKQTRFENMCKQMLDDNKEFKKYSFAKHKDGSYIDDELQKIYDRILSTNMSW